jgi:predicted O-methyltransferase YrrM
MQEKMFSLPINPKISEEFVNQTFIPFLVEHKELIFDLYFTCRMPPFEQDAMGDVFVSDPKETTLNAFYISQKTRIPLSATFNNIFVRPTQSNLDLFIENFKPLYDYGLRIVTIPHTMWIMTGQIQKEFPELYIKNTILREVSKANEVVSLARAGFHYINLDRDLMRDRDSLLKIKKAKEYCKSIGKPIKLSLLVNETCWGGCPIMDEHYHYNNTRTNDDPQFFNDPISRTSCSKWSLQDSSSSLKAANLPPWREDWEEFLELGIDVFKLHGRESAMRLNESMDIIQRWKRKDILMFSLFNEYIEDLSLKERPIDIWREKIKSCKFDCWDCNYCESVVESRLRKQNLVRHPYISIVLSAIDNSGMQTSNFNEQDFDISGLSCHRVRHLLNSICSNQEIKYLEVGAYLGSTFCAAIQNNTLEAYAVDNWKITDIQPAENNVKIEQSSYEEFKLNVKKYKGNSKIRVINADVKNLVPKDFHSKVNFVFYDGDHNYQEQLEALEVIKDLVEDTFIVILDDANFEGVVESADEFIYKNHYKILFERKFLNSIEDDKMWWNGLYILILQK